MSETIRDFRAVSQFGAGIFPRVAARSAASAEKTPASAELTQSEQHTKSGRIESDRTLGGWRLRSLVYQRGSASIYRADAIGSATCSRTQYAVKVVSEESREEALAVERLRREWTASRAATQRNLISILSGHVHCAPYYLVMPWIEGVNVGRHLAKHGRLATPVALWIARQTAEALGTLHAAGYLHGDIRPSKLMIDRSGHVTLVGLGSAKAWPDEPTLADDAISGSPYYLSPETFAGRPSDPRSDLYSLGMTLFEMLAGRLPEMGTNLAQLSEFKRGGRLPSVRGFAPQVPSEVSGYVRHLIANQPVRRPQHAKDVVQSLMRLEIATLSERVPG